MQQAGTFLHCTSPKHFPGSADVAQQRDVDAELKKAQTNYDMVLSLDASQKTAFFSEEGAYEKRLAELKEINENLRAAAHALHQADQQRRAGGPNGALQTEPFKQAVTPFSEPFKRAGGPNGGRKAQGYQAAGHQAVGQPGSLKRLRGAIFVLKACRTASSAAAATRDLMAGLLAIDAASSAPLTGPLLGMAAAQAGRLGLRDLLEVLCGFAWSRLPQWGGREVAELTYAAAHANCTDRRLFASAALFCFNHHGSFTCLRDVALMSSALIKHHLARSQDAKAHWQDVNEAGNEAGPFDVALGFHGLAIAAARELQNDRSKHGNVSRDVADFAYTCSQVFHLQPINGGPPLHKTPAVADGFVFALSCISDCLHMASPQDIAKFSCAVSVAWTLLDHLREDVIKPCLLDIAQAIRFQCGDFNTQDTSLTITALAKFDFIEDIIADILVDRVVVHAPKFTNKDLCLLLWSVAHSTWADHCKDCVLQEIQKRNLSSFLVKDLCMATQALAKLGDPGQSLLGLLMAQAFDRELHNFSVCDRMYLLWAVAKSKVPHVPLCRMIMWQLVARDCSCAPRGALGVALWSLAVLYPALKPMDEHMSSLVTILCQAAPWQAGASYEVANSAWAFGQLSMIVPLESWVSLCKVADLLKPSQISSHELCNLLHGFAACPKEADVDSILLARLASEVSSRLARKSAASASAQADGRDSKGLDTLSDHDLRSLSGMLICVGHPLPTHLQELAEQLQFEDGVQWSPQSKSQIETSGYTKFTTAYVEKPFENC